MASLYFLFFAGAQGNLMRWTGDLNLVDVIRHTTAAKGEIEEVRRRFTGTPEPYVDSVFGLHEWFNGDGSLFRNRFDRKCFYKRRKMLVASDGFDIEIVPTEDDNTANYDDDSNITIHIESSTARVETSSFGWRTENSKTFGLDGTVGFGFPGATPVFNSVSFSHGTTEVYEQKEDKTHSQEKTLRVSKQFVCRGGFRCITQTWTFAAKYHGTCPSIPLVDPVCYKTVLDGYSGIDAYRVESEYWKAFDVQAHQYLHSNLSLPSVHGQLSHWSKVGERFYKMTRNGSPAGKVIPSRLKAGVWWPQEGIYAIDYTDNGACQLTHPVFQSGKLLRIQLVIKIPITDKAKAGVRRKKQAPGKSEAVDATGLGIEVEILERIPRLNEGGS
ncbi:hypothetical protein DCS_05274 [Drechmeria coniospora]|uniref:Uncharacterized protein n=1 Tax=Drechmeria coniospora TaxID=98403 RepID=A0A151GMK9_DRECN|nr:hypothetical protein DCS_05274 [Drechmeria coniospora]KYK58261.1 hypothetical protein DCS_05274 [Drechmeria coniospora]ODA82902.1 hypothetical protein RJ55_01411 [Drechmeria coniospora]